MDDYTKGFAMRRMMPAFILLATLVAPAAAQSESPAASSILASPAPAGAIPSPTVVYAPSESLYGYGTGSQLAAYMNGFPNHPNLWSSYPAERAERLAHLYHHVNGCDCLDCKRNLHSHPSVVCSKDCENKSCVATGEVAKAPVINRYKSMFTEGISKLHSTPSDSITSSAMPLKSFRVVRTEPTSQSKSTFQSKLFGTASAPSATTR